LVILGMTVLITLFVVSLAYLGILWYRLSLSKDVQTIRTQVGQLEEEIVQYENYKKDAIEVQTRIGWVRQLLDKHIYWTEFLAKLEKYTIPEVYYSDLSADTGGSLVLSAHGINFTSVAKQLLALRQAADFVEKVSITSASVQAGEGGQVVGVDFGINLTLVDGVFYK